MVVVNLRYIILVEHICSLHITSIVFQLIIYSQLAKIELPGVDFVKVKK